MRLSSNLMERKNKLPNLTQPWCRLYTLIYYNIVKEIIEKELTIFPIILQFAMTCKEYCTQSTFQHFSSQHKLNYRMNYESQKVHS